MNLAFAPLRRTIWPLVLAILLAAGSALGAPPPENRCPAMSATPGASVQEDAAPMPLREGMVLSYEDMLSLRSLLPSEIWRHRDQFFFEGMKLEIGPCHRRYPVPPFFSDASEEFAGRAELDGDGNLRRYVAGIPFPPDSIDSAAADAGGRWAWNLQMRYRGAGPIGKFRLVDMPASMGSVQTYEGTYFYIQSGHRADLAKTDYRLPEAAGSDFVAGGRFDEPTNTRHLAWKQLRPREAREKYGRSDDTFVYVPTMRKMRRAPTPWVDGVYTPRYRIGGDSGGGSAPLGGGEYSIAGTISPTAGESIATAEHIRQGFSDLAIRPNAYVWRIRGEREVLAPINSSRAGYPRNEFKNFGPSGLSVADDRWDVRWAVVLEGLAKQPGRGFDAITIYVDYQTQVPLYIMTERRNGRPVEIGIPVHRFSGDVFDYPEWPGGVRALVFDPVAAVYFNASTGGSGWRRESYAVQSVPASNAALMRYLSPAFLLRGR
jgi:hypothetical protein